MDKTERKHTEERQSVTIAAQVRRSMVERDDRIVRREFLRLSNGSTNSKAVIAKLTIKQNWKLASQNRKLRGVQ